MQNKSFYQEKIVTKDEHTISKTIFVNCAICEEELVKCVQILEIPKEITYIFMCPKCGGKSFKKHFKCKTVFEPIDCNIENVEYSEKENLCLVKLK